MTTGVKEAGLQTLVLTNRYCRNSIFCKAHKRPFGEGKVAHHTNAYNQQFPLGRCDRHWQKDKALTRGGLGIDSVSMRQAISRVIVGEDATEVAVSKMIKLIRSGSRANSVNRPYSTERQHTEGRTLNAKDDVEQLLLL